MTVDSAQPVTCKQRRAAKNWRTSQTGLFLVLQVSAQPVRRALFQYFCSGIEAKSELIRVEGDLAHRVVEAPSQQEGQRRTFVIEEAAVQKLFYFSAAAQPKTKITQDNPFVYHNIC